MPGARGQKKRMGPRAMVGSEYHVGPGTQTQVPLQEQQML